MIKLKNKKYYPDDGCREECILHGIGADEIRQEISLASDYLHGLDLLDEVDELTDAFEAGVEEDEEHVLQAVQ